MPAFAQSMESKHVTCQIDSVINYGHCPMVEGRMLNYRNSILPSTFDFAIGSSSSQPARVGI